MSSARKDVGKAGEEMACTFLSSRGHSIIARNWRCGHHEVDIITVDCMGLHIVEVKTRVAPCPVAPYFNVGNAKQKALTAAAKEFLHSPQARALDYGLELFFDIVSITFDGERADIEYIPQAFIPVFF